MNRVFKVVFNRERGKSMVVNELTRSHQVGKKAAITVAVASALFAGSALAQSTDKIFNDTQTGKSVLEASNIVVDTTKAQEDKNALNFTGDKDYFNWTSKNQIKITSSKNAIQIQTPLVNSMKATGDINIVAKNTGIMITNNEKPGNIGGGSLNLEAKNLSISGNSALLNSSTGTTKSKGEVNINVENKLSTVTDGRLAISVSGQNAINNINAKIIDIAHDASNYKVGAAYTQTRAAVIASNNGLMNLGSASTEAISISTKDSNAKATAYGVLADNGQLKLQAKKLFIQSSNNSAEGTAFAIGAINGGKISIDKTIADITGDIKLEGASSINLSMFSKNSHLKGNIFSAQDATMKLALAQEAAWTNTEDSQVTELKLDGGIVNINLDDKKQAHEVTVDKLVGTQGTLNVEVNKTKTDFEYGQLVLNAPASAKALLAEPSVPTLDVNLKGITSDNITPEQFKKVSQDIVVEESKGADGQEVTKPASKVQTTTSVEEGDYNGEMKIVSKDGKPGEVIVAEASSLMKDSLALASAGTLSLNRILMNDVRKRLGDIRVAGDMDGAWARYDGGKLSGDDGLENKFHTIQLGYDMALSNGPRVGMAASYTKGDTEYKRGDADMNAYSLAAYSVWMADNGMFADVIARVAKAENDMKVDGSRKGSLDSMAYSVSGEFGWRFDLTDMVYVEPQVEATYTYIDSDSMKLGSSRFDFDNVDSLMGRAGFAAGFKCPADKGDVYVRVSAVHEFLGDAAITGGNGKVFEVDGKDTWVEYGIGANFNVNKNTYVYADLERTSGATLDEDWRANVGVRYNF